MDDRLELMKVLDLLYGSILDEGDLEPALAAVSAFCGARGSYVLTFDRLTHTADSSTSVGVDPAAQSEYLDQYSAEDVRVPGALAKPIGALVTEHELVHPDTFKSCDIYRDFLTRHDIPHFLALWTRKSATRLSALALQRSAAQGPFLNSDKERLAPLVPHLVRALEIRETLQAARAAKSVYAEVLDRLPFGVVMLDWARVPMEISRTAEYLFRSSGVIQIRNGRVSAACTDDDDRLQQAIFLTINNERNAETYGRTFALRHKRNLRTLRVTVLPVPKSPPYMQRPPACMLLIFDPVNLPTSSVEMVKRSLQLTTAEARLACELCRGVSLREAASVLRLSINTCKTQLKSIYARTGCRNHAELAKALLISGMAQYAAPGEQHASR